MSTVKTNSFSHFKMALVIATVGFSFTSAAFADEEFYGTVESRPTENPGIWVISGQQVEVTDKTEIENDNGPLVVGSCVEVEHKKGVVKEIESAKPSKCGRK